MSENCNHDCSSCGKSCGERTSPESFLAPPNAKSNIGKVIAVASGKGGVGKSLVTALLASAIARRGRKAAILDADVTGPSIPAMFGIGQGVRGGEHELEPAVSKTGVRIMSLNLLLDDPTSPVVWRGPVIAGVVKQFWTDVAWGDIDIMFVDMPPGTGDVPLTVFQSLPVDGVVIATSPQQLVGMIVEKAANMAAMMNKPVAGIVENMAFFKCPECGATHRIYGAGGAAAALAGRLGAGAVCTLPLDPAIAAAADSGGIESVDGSALDAIVDQLLQPATAQ